MPAASATLFATLGKASARAACGRGSWLRQAFFQSFYDRLQHLDARVVFVLRFDQRPGRLGRAGLQEHLLNRNAVSVPAGAIAPIFFGQLVPAVGIEFAALEPPQLFFPGDVQPELADDHAKRKLVGLKLVDFAIGAAPILFAAETLDALHQNAAVIAAVENRQMAGARQAPPEAPKIMVRLFLTVRRGVAGNAVAARIENRRDALDGSAFARRVPSLEDAEHRQALSKHLELKLAQAQLELGELL